LVADRFGDDVQPDHVGMRVVSAAVARRSFAERAEQKARSEEEFRRLQEMAEREAPRVSTGVPALPDGASPFESLMAGDRSYVSPEREFSRRPNPILLVDDIEQGQRQQALARAEAEAKKAKR
jgi:hypothetical protein